MVVVEEFFLHGAIEPLDVGVHLWRLRVRVPVSAVNGTESSIKVLLELGAVVSEHIGETVRKDRGHEVEELTSSE